jgi:hypothetical protein
MLCTFDQPLQLTSVKHELRSDWLVDMFSVRFFVLLIHSAILVCGSHSVHVRPCKGIPVVSPKLRTLLDKHTGSNKLCCSVPLRRPFSQNSTHTHRLCGASYRRRALTAEDDVKRLFSLHYCRQRINFTDKFDGAHPFLLLKLDG